MGISETGNLFGPGPARRSLLDHLDSYRVSQTKTGNQDSSARVDMPVPDRFVLAGIHKDSDRMLHIVVRNDPKYAPHNLLSMIQHMPAAQQCSLAAFAECYAESGPTCAQAVGKILGDPDFRTKYGIAPGSSTILKFDHLTEQYPDPSAPIQFNVMHKDELCDRLEKSDAVHFVEIDGSPYFLGDYMNARPTGILDLAATMKMRDIVWLDVNHVLAGPEYYWEQYLNEIRTSYESYSRTRATIQRLLQNRPSTVGDAVHYSYEGKCVDMQALEIASRPSHEVYIVGPGRFVVRPGMGIVFDFPIWLRAACKVPSNPEFLDQVHGVITSFSKSSDPRNPVNITIALHLSSQNLPSHLLSRLNDSHLLQTNRQMTISEIFVTGVFSLWPANMIQGTCAPNETSLHDRAVMGHIDIHENDLGPDSEHSQLGSLIGHDVDDRDSDSQSITSEYAVRDARGVLRQELLPHVRKMIEPLLGIYNGRYKVEIFPIHPLPAKCALGCLRAQDDLFNPSQVAFPDADSCPAIFNRH